MTPPSPDQTLKRPGAGRGGGWLIFSDKLRALGRAAGTGRGTDDRQDQTGVRLKLLWMGKGYDWGEHAELSLFRSLGVCYASSGDVRGGSDRP
jgi:hypothetical protein